MDSACMLAIASSTGALISIVFGAGAPRSSRCIPSSRPWNVVAGWARSVFQRSAPQFAQTSSPAKLPNRQTGQITGAPPLELVDRPGLAGVEKLPEVPRAAGRRRLGELVVQHLVVRRPGDPPDHADGHRELGPVDVAEH